MSRLTDMFIQICIQKVTRNSGIEIINKKKYNFLVLFIPIHTYKFIIHFD